MRRIQAINCFGKDAGTGGLPHTTWSAEEIGMRQLIAGNGIFERGGECFLPHDGAKGGRPVFSRRNNKSIHDRIGQIVRHKCTKNIGFLYLYVKLKVR